MSGVGTVMFVLDSASNASPTCLLSWLPVAPMLVLGMLTSPIPIPIFSLLSALIIGAEVVDFNTFDIFSTSLLCEPREMELFFIHLAPTVSGELCCGLADAGTGGSDEVLSSGSRDGGTLGRSCAAANAAFDRGGVVASVWGFVSDCGLCGPPPTGF